MSLDKNKINKKSGEIIFRERERAGLAYIIEKGQVEVSVERDGNTVVLGVLGPGEILGEMAVIDQYCRTATATVREDCELTVITPEQIHQRINRTDPVIRSLLSILLSRYRSELALEGGLPMEDDNAWLSQYKGIGKIRFENELRDALDNRQVQVLYQTIRSLKQGSRSGLEALVRWDHAMHGLISPAALISLAEETDLIETLSLYVFRAAVEDLVEFRDASPEPIFLSVNVSPRHTVDSNLLNRAWDMCSEIGCRPEDIMLELTESVRVDVKQLSEWVETAKAMGFLISVDDFGTGFTSLEYLTRLAPHSVKIDRNFIRFIVNDPRHVTVLRKVLEMAAELGIKVIAEGAETSEHVQILSELGCDMVQGFQIDRPLTKFQTIELLSG